MGRHAVYDAPLYSSRWTICNMRVGISNLLAVQEDLIVRSSLPAAEWDEMLRRDRTAGI